MLRLKMIQRLLQSHAQTPLILLLGLILVAPWAYGQDTAGSIKPEDLARTATIKTTSDAVEPQTAPAAGGAVADKSTAVTTGTVAHDASSPIAANGATSAISTGEHAAKATKEGGKGEGASGAASNAKSSSSTAPYMHDVEPLEIFDKEKEVKENPLHKAAQIFAERKAERKARSLAGMQNLLIYDYELKGPKEEDLMNEAALRALKAAAGRLYFANYFLLGRDLLEPYLRNFGKQFIARSTVLDAQTIGQNEHAMKIRVCVNLDTFYKDLEEKKFIAEPNPRPIAAVFLQELVEGQANVASGGRARIEQTLEQNMFRAFSSRMQTPPLNQDLNGSPKLLKKARMEAQRNNVDVLITGTMSVHSRAKGQIYYDNYDFEEADIALKMIRVDTGEQIAEAKDRYSASAPTMPEAVKKVLDVMVNRTAQGLAEKLTGMWSSTMLEQPGIYRIMVNRANPTEVTSVYNLLKTLSPGIALHEKSYYGNVLVFNMTYPGATAEQLETFLRTAKEPQFLVRKVGKRDFILDLI